MTSYETTDLYLAGALKTALRLPFPNIRFSGRLSAFAFQIDPIKAQRVAVEFYNDSLHVPARRYAQDLRDLKMLICQHREKSG